MSGEIMQFPETFDEFAKQYSFYDTKESYYSDNTELIPVFRVQQWLDHVADKNKS